jgi:hypothetical protein
VGRCSKRSMWLLLGWARMGIFVETGEVAGVDRIGRRGNKDGCGM